MNILAKIAAIVMVTGGAWTFAGTSHAASADNSAAKKNESSTTDKASCRCYEQTMHSGNVFVNTSSKCTPDEDKEDKALWCDVVNSAAEPQQWGYCGAAPPGYNPKTDK